MGLAKIAINRQTKQIVSFNGSDSSLPPLYQTNLQAFRVQVVDPSGGKFNTTYTAVDCDGLSLRMVLATRATGILGDQAENLLAATYEAGWTWDAGSDAFLGSLDLDTAEIVQFLADNPSAQAILEITLIDSGEPETLFGQRGGETNVTICANADEGAADAPSVIADSSIATKSLVHGVAGVTISGNVVTVASLGLGFTPSNVLVFINAPSGSGAIAPNLVIGSITSGGFSFVMTGVPENNDYTFTYILVV